MPDSARSFRVFATVILSPLVGSVLLASPQETSGKILNARDLYPKVITGSPMIEKTSSGEVLQLLLRQIGPEDAAAMAKIEQLGYMSGKDLRTEALKSVLLIKCNADDIKSGIFLNVEKFEGKECRAKLTIINAKGSKLDSRDFSPADAVTTLNNASHQKSSKQINFPMTFNKETSGKTLSVKLTFTDCVVALKQLEFH